MLHYGTSESSASPASVASSRSRRRSGRSRGSHDVVPPATALATCHAVTVVALLVALAGVPTAVLGQLASAERSALVELYNVTSGGTWRARSGWVADNNGSNDPCVQAWQGVVCSSSVPQHVMYAACGGTSGQGGCTRCVRAVQATCLGSRPPLARQREFEPQWWW